MPWTQTDRVMERQKFVNSYTQDLEPRNVRRGGSIKWDGEFVFVGEAFAGETVGIQAIDEGLWHVHSGRCGLACCTVVRARLRRSRTVSPMCPDTVRHEDPSRCPG